MSTATADTGSATLTDQPAARQLRRSGEDKMLVGVTGGIALYLEDDRRGCRRSVVRIPVDLTPAGLEFSWPSTSHSHPISPDLRKWG